MPEKPVRLQRKRTKGFKLVSPNSLPNVYVGRGSKYGNPFVVKQGGQRKLEGIYYYIEFQNRVFGAYHTKKDANARAAEIFGIWLKNNKLTIKPDDIINELCNKNLVCWCRLSEPCHGDALLELANRAKGKVK